MPEARHPRIRIVLLGILNLVPYPPVAPSPCDPGKVWADLSALTLKTVAINAPLISKKFGADWRALSKQKNKRANCCNTHGKPQFQTRLHALIAPSRLMAPLQYPVIKFIIYRLK